MQHENKGSRAMLAVLSVVLGLMLAAMICFTVYFQFLVGRIAHVDSNTETVSQEVIDQMASEDQVSPEENTAPEMGEEDVDWGEDADHLIKTPDHVVNILLIGQDAREGWGRSRSDTMILVTLNKDTKTITLTSFLRDMYVKIPGYQDNKLNATYVYGGMELLDETLAQNFGIQVDGNVEVDFSHFADVIELLGGVEMELRDDEAAYINKKLNAKGKTSNLVGGVQHLNGDQALWYSRIRYLDADADFSRTNRQRKVINALIDQFRSAGWLEMLNLLEELLPMITTDLSSKEIISYAIDLFPMLKDCTVVSQRVPADGTYSFKTIRGMSCIVADMDAARELLEQTIRG